MCVSLFKIMVLLVAYQVKHFIADFPLQTPYMLQKFKSVGWVLPLAAHAGVHALFTLGIALAVLWHVPGGIIWALVAAAFDFGVHFTMDRIKASPKMWGRYQALSADEYRSVAHKANYEGANPELLLNRDHCRKRLADNTEYWLALGVDQKVHHLTHYAIIAFLIMKGGLA